jgi:hypothetical protein
MGTLLAFHDTDHCLKRGILMMILKASSYLTHGEERFGVLGDVLGLSSPVFLDFHDKHKDADYQVISSVSSDSIRAFLDACQSPFRPPPTITCDNALDLLALCDEFQTPAFRGEVQAFIQFHGPRMIIPGIKRGLEDGTAMTDLETQLREQLIAFLADPALETLPFPCLARVFALQKRLPNEDFDRIFEYCLSLFDKYAQSASVLFRGLDIWHCNPDQIYALQARPNFPWCFLADSLSVRFMEVSSMNANLCRGLEAEHAEVVRLRSEREDLAARLGSVERTLQDCVRQSEHRETMKAVDDLSGRVCSVEAKLPDCVTQSEHSETMKIIAGLQND